MRDYKKVLMVVTALIMKEISKITKNEKPKLLQHLKLILMQQIGRSLS